MEEKEAPFCYEACEVIDEDGTPKNKIRHVPEEITYKKLLWGNVIPCLTVVIDRRKVGDFSMPQIGHEDYATWLTIMKKIDRAYGIDEVLGYYRVNHNSVSGHKFRTIRWTWNIYRKNQKLSRVKSVCYLVGHLTQAICNMK